MLSHQPLGTRRPGRVHKTLHKHQIEPATEFVSDLPKISMSPALRLILLCHRTRRIFRVKRRVQHGQRGSVRAIATSSLR